MTLNELQAMTVLQLRKLARDNRIKLSAGIDKAGIIERIAAATSDQSADAPSGELQEEMPVEVFSAPEETASPVQERAAQAPEAEEPRFRAAWHSNPAPASPAPAPRFNARPAYQAPSVPAGHAPWQSANIAPRAEQHVQPTRPGTNVPRFGPASSAPAQPAPAPADRPPVTRESMAHPVSSPLPERRFGYSSGESNGFGPRAVGTLSASYTPGARSVETGAGGTVSMQDTSAPTLEELLASGDYIEGGGTLELHPDGYGFLRSSHFLPSSKDVYVSMAQIRRFGLRTGDYITGKIRPQREGDKYGALLYISAVNGLSEQEALSRPLFDELTPTYPSRRVSLEASDGTSLQDMRLIDLIAPLGFGQRGLLLCPPGTGKTELLQHFAQVISMNYPDVETLMLLIDVNPEDVTMMRDSVPCHVLASTFDQAPEVHLRLAEVVLERAMRLVEQQKDVVVLVDSLTRLAKIYTTAAVQQGRSLPGMVNPASLFRAKRLFGAARACKEGGSLTVIAAMDIATGSKVDDSVVEEFKGTANMELTLDAAVARAGIRPAINLQHSFTKNADILLDSQQKEGLSLIRQMLSSTSSAAAIPQLESMMDKAATNSELLLKMKDWFALMNR